jgi:curli production assembly/transport component CsgG
MVRTTLIRQNKTALIVLVSSLLATGCTAANKFLTTSATLDYQTAVHEDLRSLPLPEKKIVVAVYKFKDQTGQYKFHPTATTFSTAVTQGATSMLIKALEESGWFLPVEREGLPDLLTERKIVRETQKETELPSLLSAPIVLEGGVVAYETNLITGGVGVKYYGAGGSADFRRDSVSIYLRTTSVADGRVIKSVMTQKTILSKEVDIGVFRFVKLKRLLEIETGLSTNEPPQMCVLEAIEKAVYSLILEGVISRLWTPADREKMMPIIQEYLNEKGEHKKAELDENGNISVTGKKK